MPHACLVTLPQSFASGVIGARDILNLDSDMLGTIDERAGASGLSFCTEVVGAARQVDTVFGPPLVMDRLFGETGAADLVYIPPIAVPPDRAPDCDPAMLQWLCDQHDAGALVCAACTGTLVLAASGLLDGMPATTHWAYEGTFREYFPAVELDARRTLVVGGDDGDLVTAGAHASWYDLMLYLVHRYSGAATARRIARIFLLDWHDLDQNAYASFRDNRQHGDTAILVAQDWLRKNLSRADPVESAMAASGLSARSFHRRFRQATGRTPLQYTHQLRVEHAKELLEASDLAIEEVAWQVGYDDTPYFRRLFRRITGVTPACYRKAFRTPANIADQLPSTGA